jgi:hypothetical protein
MGKGHLEIRSDRPSGSLIGSLEVDRKRASGFRKWTGRLKKIEGGKDIYLVFKGNKKFGTELDYFRFIEYKNLTYGLDKTGLLFLSLPGDDNAYDYWAGKNAFESGFRFQ